MFVDNVKQIAEVASKNGTSVFVAPPSIDVEIKNALVLAPEEKSVITIEQVREVLARLAVKQTSDVYVVIRPAEALGEEAANAMLKNLEEPGDKVHFVLVTNAPSQLLTTILSRAAVYFLRVPPKEGIDADAKVKDIAKRLMVAKPGDLPALADEIAKKKDGVRSHALLVVGTAIEMLYKSYFITGKDVFMRKLPKFLACYEALSNNGHVKLHLVADLM
ncbi:hypothetical protein IKG68_01090 [Candidatus Saccharibacteria bacterium]|nr:hypothetical protein [Candidatus Saccharibacteria bacterium]